MVITWIYMIMTAFFGLVLLWNFWKAKGVQEAILYLVILIPFALRVFQIK